MRMSVFCRRHSKLQSCSTQDRVERGRGQASSRLCFFEAWTGEGRGAEYFAASTVAGWESFEGGDGGEEAKSGESGREVKWSMAVGRVRSSASATWVGGLGRRKRQ